MRHLVALGQGEDEVPNRRTVPYRDFTASEGTDDDQKAGAKGFVDLFIQERLLVADTDPRGEVTVSVVHEALLREWQRIREWLKENREFLRMRDRLDSSLKLWLSRGKQTDDLLEPGQWLQAERHRRSAEKNAALARAEEARTKQALASEAQVSAKLHDQLRQASWTSFNQAERQFLSFSGNSDQLQRMLIATEVIEQVAG